jgi:hypothetical protein
MAAHMWSRWLAGNRRRKSQEKTVRRRQTSRLLLEQLEDRVVPTVVFDPQFPKEAVSAAPYTVINNPTIYLIFWGTNWAPGQPLGPGAVTQLTKDATAVIGSPYFGGLTEYGNIGNVTLGGAWTDSSSNPPAGFNVGSSGALTAEAPEITTALSKNSSWVANASSIFAVIPVGGSSGYNGQGTVTYQGSSVTANICSVGGASNPTTGSITDDWFTQTFSHEVAERITDPGAGGVSITFSSAANFPGYVGYNTPNVNNDPTRTDNQPWMANSAQIGDGEQELSGDQHYGYRLTGSNGANVKVQSFWSAQTPDSLGNPGAFIVPDGNTKSVYLQAVWSTTPVTLNDPTGQGPPVTFNAPFFNTSDKYDLLIIGTGNDSITVNASDSTTTVNLDGQNFVFGPLVDGGQIRNITIDGAGGSNTFTVQALAADQNVTIDSIGSDNIYIGSGGDLTGILGTIRVENTANTTPTTTVNINDSSDGQNKSRTVTLDQTVPSTEVVYTTSFSGLGTIDINARSVANLNITGFAFGDTFNVLSTIDGATTTLNTDGANDTVTVHHTSGALIINNPNGQDTVTVGDPTNGVQGIYGAVTASGSGTTALIVDDSGDSNSQPSVQISATQITGLQISGATATINYGQANLSSLTVNTGSGGNTFSVLSTPAPTTIQAGTGSDSVQLGDAGHNLSGISSVTVNGNGKTTLEVSDAGNATTPAPFTSYTALSTTFAVDAGQLTRSARANVSLQILPPPFPPTSIPNFPFTMTVGYSGLASLTVDGGPAVAVTPTPYRVLNTLGTSAAVINANGSDAVTLGDATHNLSGIGSVTVNGNYKTTLEVSDAGNATTPAGFAAYAPVSTVFTIDAGQLTRSARANVSLQILPPPFPPTSIPNFPFTMTVGYSGLASLTVDGGPAVAVTPTPYHVLNTLGTKSLTLRGGNATSTFNLQGTSVGTTTTVYTGTTLDQINVGSNPVNPPQSIFDPIQGPITVYGVAGNTSMTVNDQGTSTTQNWDVANSWIDRFPAGGSRPAVPQITYHNLAAVTVNTGTGQSIIGVISTAAGTNTMVNANGGGFDETFVENVANMLDDIQGPLHLHDVSLSNLFIVDGGNTVGHTYTLTTGEVQRDGIQPITYDNMGQVVVATANNPYFGHTPNTVNVQSLGPDVFAVVEVGTADTVTVGQNGVMASILGDIRIQSVLGQVPKQVTLDDSSDTNPHTITLGSAPTFGYLVNGLLPPSSVGRGRIGLALDPKTPVSILGGPADDVFRIQDFTGAPALSLVAEPATSTRTNPHNKLDYSAYTGTVEVVLPLGYATGFAGISGIQDVTGGMGNSMLVGDANPNILVGGTGRNVLIGGAGADTLDASRATGDNILIGGATDFDSNLAALNAIFAEWTRTDLSYRDRFSDLTTGTNGQNATPLNQVNGLPILLTPSTVHADSSPDQLIGSNLIDPATGKRVHNWFFVDADDTVVNFLSSSDHETKVK